MFLENKVQLHVGRHFVCDTLATTKCSCIFSCTLLENIFLEDKVQQHVARHFVHHMFLQRQNLAGFCPELCWILLSVCSSFENKLKQNPNKIQQNPTKSQQNPNKIPTKSQQSAAEFCPELCWKTYFWKTKFSYLWPGTPALCFSTAGHNAAALCSSYCAFFCTFSRIGSIAPKPPAAPTKNNKIQID